MNNQKKKIIKCRVKSDSTFTDLVGYELHVIRDKAFYKIDDVVPLDGDFDEKSESLFQKYYGFLIGREELDLNVYDHRKELAETFKGFKEGGTYSPIGKVDTSNPPKTNEMPLKRCKVKPGYAYYNDLKDLELLVTPNQESKGYYILKYIDISSFKGDQNEWDKLIKNYRVGGKEEPFHIPEKYLDFQIIYNEKTSPSKETGTDPVREFESGAKRDGDANKPYVHNLQGYTRLRYGFHTRMGARKYGDGNFLKGFPDESLKQSIDRHWAQYLDGDRSEDHLSSILFGINSLMLNEKSEGIKPDHWFKYEK